MLMRAGLERARAVIISFADPGTAIGIFSFDPCARREVPVLVRTQDDSRLNELREAGATTWPETLEASLMLVSQVLMLLDVPVGKVVRTVRIRKLALRGAPEHRELDGAVSCRSKRGRTIRAAQNRAAAARCLGCRPHVDEVRARALK